MIYIYDAYIYIYMSCLVYIYIHIIIYIYTIIYIYIIYISYIYIIVHIYTIVYLYIYIYVIVTVKVYETGHVMYHEWVCCIAGLGNVQIHGHLLPPLWPRLRQGNFKAVGSLWAAESAGRMGGR